MREILFSGKLKGENEWITGNLLFYSDVNRAYISLGVFKGGSFLEVQKETVGQYTGLTDKNGKKIFEGDIVKFCDIKGVINYSTGCYCVKTNKPDWKSRNNPAIDIVLNEYENELEVIGNIHDNPELLKGGADNE